MHRLSGSKAKAYYGDVYHLPEWLGRFDVAFFGAILLHLARPFEALASASKIADDIIITDLYRDGIDTMDFINNGDPIAWWYLGEKTAERMLRALGYNHFSVSTSRQLNPPNTYNSFYTLIAKR
jgi:hypothetical protein